MPPNRGFQDLSNNMGNKLCLEGLPDDIVYEILGHMAVEDIVRVRLLCRYLWRATSQRNVWDNIYRRSKLLLPQGPLPSHCATQLEFNLVRATKLHRNWTSNTPFLKGCRRLPLTLPAYGYDASVVSGRYLQIAGNNGISWYDLDSRDMGKPILSYLCPNIYPTDGYLHYHVNANGEGEDVFWVSFLTRSPYSKICVLKVTLGGLGPRVELHAEIKAHGVTSIQMENNWLLPIREFTSPNSLSGLFHIPTRTTVYFPTHEKAHHPSDLLNLKYATTSDLLFVMLSLQNETLVDVYPLPVIGNTMSPVTTSNRLVRSFSGVYPHAISKLHILDAPYQQPTCLSRAPVRVSFLALAYLNRSPATWSSKIGLHLFDAIMDPDSTGSLTCIIQCQTTLNVGLVATSLSLSARGGTCLAVTHSSPGPVILAHHIQCLENSQYTTSVQTLKCPPGVQSRKVLSFDGFRGRLFLISEWTNIDMLDFA